jgi:enoyl-CoA hydratase
MAEDASPIVTSLDGALAVIRFNRPAQRNPLSISTLQLLETTLSELTLRSDVKALIFTGTADVFASGADIRELAQLDSASALEFSQLGQRVFQKIADATQLTLAAINGYCMGGALDLALACDIRVAAIDAIFAHPGARLGIITGWGGTQRLPRLIQKARAFELFLTGRRITSAEALEMRLINSVSDSPLDSAILIALNSLLQDRDS